MNATAAPITPPSPPGSPPGATVVTLTDGTKFDAGHGTTRIWVERVTINTIDSNKVITDDYAEYSLKTLTSGPEEHFASTAVLVAPDDTEARTALFLEEQSKAQEEVANAKLDVARQPYGRVAERRLTATQGEWSRIDEEFGAFMTAVPAYVSPSLTKPGPSCSVIHIRWGIRGRAHREEHHDHRKP